MKFPKFSGGESPFGIIFLLGRAFIGFHVRFRDIARGGMRLVRPISHEQHTVAVRGVLNECYRLAWAQQLKNKDIPEGGSKGVLVLSPKANAPDAARTFTDGILDLILPYSSNQVNPLTDYYGEKELIYLGPDENCTDAVSTISGE